MPAFPTSGATTSCQSQDTSLIRHAPSRGGRGCGSAAAWEPDASRYFAMAGSAIPIGSTLSVF